MVNFIFHSQNPQHFNDSFDGNDVTIMIDCYLFPIWQQILSFVSWEKEAREDYARDYFDR